MYIPVDRIISDPAQITKDDNSRARRPLRKGQRTPNLNQPIVVRPTNGAGGPYMIVVGERRWKTARTTGLTEIECTLRDDLNEQDIKELQLSESYHHEHLPPMKMGRMFMDYRETFVVSQQELARRTGITPGTIHHYESLVRNLAPDLGAKVESGELTFKEGRSIADIDGHQRQREIAGPFVSGRLSSVYVEKVVGRAKKAPDMPVEQLLDEVLKGTRAESRVQKSADPAPRSGLDISKLETAAIELAGHLDALQLQTIPEYKRLNIISALRILDSRVQGTIVFLSSGRVRNVAPVRPLIRTISR